MNAVDYVRDLIITEGGYVDHPSDRGGPTNYGITERTAARNGYHGDMRDLTMKSAEAIYLSEYWRRPNFDKVDELAPLIAEELLEAGVLSSPAVAGKWLQIALNRLNRGGALYGDIAEDGKVGPKTREALTDYLAHRRAQDGEHVLLTALNCLQGHYLMINAVAAHSRNEDFVFGWLRHRVKL